MVQQVFKRLGEFGVEFGQSGILINMQVQEVTEDVMVLFELELAEALIQGI
jgi:DNA integrity scanning protein DisA with diadenylate cyclase activity